MVCSIEIGIGFTLVWMVSWECSIDSVVVGMWYQFEFSSVNF